MAGLLDIPDQPGVGVDSMGAPSEEMHIGSIKALMLAVLQDAIICYQSRHGPERIRAAAWLFDRRADGPFAFESVCLTLGINPAYLRRGLLRWQLLNGPQSRLLTRRFSSTGRRGATRKVASAGS